MENWQKEHIRRNLVELIENIKCNDKLMDYLIAHGCLTKAERSRINGCEHDSEAKSRQLLDILETRVSGYQCLARALYMCGQTGALVNLLYGVEANNTNSNAFKYCEIAIDTAQILSRPVDFGGSILPLKEICSNVHNIQNAIADNLNVTAFRELISGNGVVIAVDTIPKKLPYYIQRSILIRTKLDEKFFSEMASDVFLIEGIEWHLLTKLAAKRTGRQTQGKLTDRSSNQLETLTLRFILLESPGHFHKIAANSRQTVHWIQHKNGEFHHVKTSGKDMTSFIHKFVSDSKENILSQPEFVSSCIEESKQTIMILYDSPGMGKSVLLADLAREVKKLHPTNIVIWMHCSEFVQTLVAATDETPTIEKIKEEITKMIAVNHFGRAILKENLNTSGRTFYLFLDAFDELSSNKQQTCIHILKCIQKCPNNFKVIITSRHHVAKSIESLSGVLGYNILPFQETDKVSFFLEYWNQQHSIQGNTVLEQFARHCIKAFTSTVSSEEREITGIPLQCRMLADIYAEEAKFCSVSTSSSSESMWMLPANVADSVFMLYENYFSVKFCLLESEEEKELFLRFHYEQAIELIFQMRFANLDSVVDKATLFRVGIMELRNGKPVFVHRTFAEFLSAKFVMSVIFETSSYDFDETFQTVVIPAVFNTIEVWDTSYYKYDFKYKKVKEMHFREKTVNFFLNNFLKRTTNINFSRKVMETLAQKRFMPMSICNAALVNKCEYTFEFLISWYACLNVTNFESAADKVNWNVKTNEFSGDLSIVVFTRAMITLATKYCSVRVVEKLCNLLFSISRKKWCELEYTTVNNPILICIWQGNYQILEYFIHTSGPQCLVGIGALHHCIENSREDSDSTIANKVQIIKLLLQQHCELLTEMYANTHAHLTFQANFKLIKELIEAGAPLNATTEVGKNIAHEAAKYCSEMEYHELVTILIAKGYNELFNRRDGFLCTPMHCVLEKLDIWTETLDLLASKCQVTFNNTDESYLITEFYKAIESGRCQRVLEDIVRLGGDIKCSYPVSALYVAVRAGNLNATNWLLSLGFNVNSWSMRDGKSILFAAIDNNDTEMVKLLVSKGANVNVVCCEEIIIDSEDQMDSMLERWISPLEYAKSNEADPEIIQMLTANGARDCNMIPCYCSPCWFCCCVPCARYFGSIYQCVVCCAWWN